MKFRDFIKLFRGQVLNCCLVVVYLTLTMVLTNLLFQNQQHIEDEQMHYASLYDGKSVYATYDTMYEHKELETKYYHEPGSQLRAERYISALEESDEFPFYICGDQYLSIQGKSIPQSCAPMNSDYGTVKSHQINYNLMHDFPVALTSGRLFTDKEYQWQIGEIVPVILGHSWNNIMHVGEQFRGKLMTMEMTFRVVGIAEENAYFPLFDNLTYEDDYIIVPTLRCIRTPQNSDEDFVQKAFANQNAAGYFRLDSNQSLSDLVSFMDTTAQQYGMFETKIMRIDQSRLLLLSVSSQKHKQVYMGLMLALFVCSLISIVALCQAVVRKNARMLSIYYLAGAAPWKISLLVVLQGLTIDAVSFLLSVILTKIAFPSMSPVNITVQIVICACICLCTIPALHSFLTNPTAYMKKE